jgi:hypothetical protein
MSPEARSGRGEGLLEETSQNENTIVENVRILGSENSNNLIYDTAARRND